MMHAACIRSEQQRSDLMVDLLILVLFLISGAATGWLGVELLPERLLEQATNIDRLRLVL
ncbi:MAG TPA: PIN/TRAM domain-containing protein, partial [Prochlorococcus sp.]